jgi:hypothetical protein
VRRQGAPLVWGPWEYNTGASAQVASNRVTKPRAYSLASGFRLAGDPGCVVEGKSAFDLGG